MENIRKLLERKTLGAPIERAFLLARLTEEWPQLLGEPWGRHSWPLRLQNAVLWIGVPDSSWAQRFAFEDRRIRLLLQARLGREIDLRIQLSRPAEQPAPQKEPVEPLHTAEVEAAISAMPDGKLRESMKGFLGRLAAFQKSDAQGEK